MPVTLDHYIRPVPANVMIIEPVDWGPTLEIVDFDAEEIQRQGGDPIFAKIERPRRKTAYVWMGNDPHNRRLDLVIDREATNQSVLEEYNTIRAWQGDPDNGTPPSRLRIRWGMWQQQLWQVSKMRWGYMATRADGHPTSIRVVIDFEEAIRPTVELSAAAQAEEATATGEASTRTYVVQPGDSLSSIAAAHLDDWERWPEIRDLNGLSSTVIHPGQELKLP